MKRLLSADLFAMRKSKILYLLPILAVGIGFLLPALYYGLFRFMDWLIQVTEELGADIGSEMQGLDSFMSLLNGRMVFLTVLPFAQGFGIVLSALLGLYDARPFGSGIIRNKIIAGFTRGRIYVSQLATSFLISMPSFLLFTGTAALTTKWLFGEIGLTGDEWLSLMLLSLGIYAVYTVIPAFAAFFTKSVPLTLLICILLPFFMSFVTSLLQPAIATGPDFLEKMLLILPSFQSMVLTVGATDGTLFAIALGADAVLTVLFALLGFLKFRKTDLS